MYDNGGALVALLSVSNSSGTVFSASLDQPGALAGVDYGWFNFADVGTNGLAIDDSELTAVPLPATLSASLALLAGLGIYRIARRKVAAV